MKNKIVQHLLILTAIVVCFGSVFSYSQNSSELNRKAEGHFAQKKYIQALGLWLEIIAVEPDNQRVMQKIEEVYEIKQKKDMSYQKSKLNYRISKNKLKSEDDEEIASGITIGWDSINSYRSAFRLDPNDTEILDFRERMKALEKELFAAEESLRLSRAMKARIQELRIIAREKMDNNEFETALVNWEDILKYIPKDTESEEGKRRCLLAIDNRIKYEKIRGFLAKGKDFFAVQQYKLAKIEYTQVLSLDGKNREASDYIEKIDEILEDKMLFEVRMQQAENLYKTGINNLNVNNFSQARDDFESVLSLVKDYKDTKIKLGSIDKLRQEWELKERQKRLLQIDLLFQEGMIAFNDSKFDISIAKFDKTLLYDKENKYAKLYLDKARKALKEQQEEEVDENSPYFEVINSLTVSGKDLYAKGKYTESAKKWDRILRLFPKNSVARGYSLKCFYKQNPEKLDIFSKNLLESGQKLLAEKKYKDAAEKFLLLKSINEIYPGVDAYIARTKVKVGKVVVYEGPEPTVERAEIEQKYEVAVRLYQKGGRENIERALATFKWIVQKDPGNVKAVINVNKIEAQLRINEGGVTVSMSQLTAEQRIKVQRYYYNGISYYSNNNLRKAVEEWQKVLLIDPGNVKARNNIRKCMAFLGKYANE